MKSSPNASPVCIEPIPPVRYVRRASVASHWAISAASSSSSPVSTATSTAPAARYIARTACPRNTVASRIGTSSWKYA